jgi:misacylated tRNA(Ala) deacylase
MTHPFYHEHPDVLTLTTEVVDAQPGRVLLTQSPFFPGGGGQLADKGRIRWSSGEASVTGFEKVGGRLWHVLDNAAAELNGTVEAAVDADFRMMMTQMHTGTHILNAVIFQEFNGALVTGVQMNDDGTARMDFDLPDVDSNRLRAVEDLINDAIRRDLAVSDSYMPLDDAYEEHGLVRTRSVAPPPTLDGKIRIVGWQDPHRGNPGPRSPGLRWDPPGVDGPIGPRPNHEDRQQGPQESPRENRVGRPYRLVRAIKAAVAQARRPAMPQPRSAGRGDRSR